MLVSALKDAALGSFPIKLMASGTVGGKTITRRGEPLSGDKPAREAFLTVLDSPPFTVELISLSAIIEQEQKAKVDVLAQRRDGFAGEIKLSVEGFSSGKDPLTKSFELKEPTLKANETLGSISLKSKVDSEVGTRTIIVKGEAVVDGQPSIQY